MATRPKATQHAETRAPAEGFQATLEAIFAWINANARTVLWALGGFVVVGGLTAGLLEYTRFSAARSLASLAAVEDTFILAMGAEPTVALIPEPANAKQAEQARSEAIAGFDAVAKRNFGSLAGHLAEIRAAELEIDLGRLEVARDRLRRVIAGLDAGEWERAIALRLLGYVLEEQGQTLEAAEAYAEAGGIQAYRARAAAFVQAGDAFARAGERERAIDAYGEAIAIDTEFATRGGVPERLDDLQAQVGVPEPQAPPVAPGGGG